MDTTGKKVNIDVDTISVLYRQYRSYFLPIGIILACILIVFFIVIPQTQQYLTNADALKAEQQKLDILTNNYNFLINLDETKLDSQLKILSSALPAGKDFAGILNGISTNASNTNVSVGDFQFLVGDLSVVPATAASPIGPLTLKVAIAGDTTSIINFISQVYKTVPIADITTVKLSAGNANLEMFFYYKPFPTQSVGDDQPILELSAQSNALITKVSSWNSSVAQAPLPLTPDISANASSGTSSFSGTVNSSPF